MPRKKKDNPAKPSRSSNQTDTQLKFIQTIVEGCGEVLKNYCAAHDRIGLTMLGRSELKNGRFGIVALLTDSFAGLLPCLPDEIRKEYNKRYYAKMDSLRNIYGEDVDNWPDEAFDALKTEDQLHIAFALDKMNKTEARIGFSLMLLLDQKPIIIKEIFDTMEYGIDLDNFWLKANLEPLFLYPFLSFQLAYWLFGASAWKTAKTRQLKLFIHNIFEELQEEFPAWEFIETGIPYKGFGVALIATASEFITPLENQQYNEACKEIIGNYFRQGLPAGFFLFANIEAPDSVTFSLHGPQAVPEPIETNAGEVLKTALKKEPIYSKTIPINSFMENEEAHYLISKDAEKVAIEIVSDICQILGWNPPEEEEED